MVHPSLWNWILGVVTAVWTINFLATLIPQLNYRSDPALHAVFGMVAGGVLALEKKESRSKAPNGSLGADKEEGNFHD